MLFIIGLPVVQIVLFCISIGKDPEGLRMAVVNYELNSNVKHCMPIEGCNWTMLSCRFLQHLDKSRVDLVSYGTEDEARDAVEKGDAWGAITFPSNYTESLEVRINDGKYADDWSIDYSNVEITMDMSSEFTTKIFILEVFFIYDRSVIN